MIEHNLYEMENYRELIDEVGVDKFRERFEELQKTAMEFIEMPLLSTIYWLFVFCDAAKVARIFDKSWMGRPVYFISTLTLEVYMVQYALFTDRFNDIFPWNILLTYIVIFLIAYFLKCSSNLFSLLFKEDRITWEKVCQV